MFLPVPARCSPPLHGAPRPCTVSPPLSQPGVTPCPGTVLTLVPVLPLSHPAASRSQADDPAPASRSHPGALPCLSWCSPIPSCCSSGPILLNPCILPVTPHPDVPCPIPVFTLVFLHSHPSDSLCPPGQSRASPSFIPSLVFIQSCPWAPPCVPSSHPGTPHHSSPVLPSPLNP